MNLTETVVFSGVYRRSSIARSNNHSSCVEQELTGLSNFTDNIFAHIDDFLNNVYSIRRYCFDIVVDVTKSGIFGKIRVM